MILVSGFLEIIKAILFGIIEGITEWLPISSTGHMLLAEKFLKMDLGPDFYNAFLYLIQLGAIIAVIVLFWHKLYPFSKNKTRIETSETFVLWIKIIIACIPGAVAGVLFNDKLDEFIGATPIVNAVVIACALIFYGIVFIVIENRHKGKLPRIDSLKKLDYKTAVLIGLIQVLSLVPGTSRSGITIIGAMLIGTSRTVAAEFTFFLAIPVMVGMGLLKLLKYGLHFTGLQFAVLIIGMLVAFIVSLIAIRFLMNFVKKHDFKAFGWYRIVLGVIVLLYFIIAGQ